MPDRSRREINRLSAKRWRLRHPGAGTAYMNSYRQRPEQREKVNARNRLRRAVADGRVPHLPCEVCGDPRSEAHHPWGYAGVLAMAVWWLCRWDHKEVHRVA